LEGGAPRAGGPRAAARQLRSWRLEASRSGDGVRVRDGRGRGRRPPEAAGARRGGPDVRAGRAGLGQQGVAAALERPADAADAALAAEGPAGAVEFLAASQGAFGALGADARLGGRVQHDGAAAVLGVEILGLHEILHQPVPRDLPRAEQALQPDLEIGGLGARSYARTATRGQAERQHLEGLAVRVLTSCPARSPGAFCLGIGSNSSSSPPPPRPPPPLPIPLALLPLPPPLLPP
ncbi:unnamed protein product, partial [Prorocentrum cordatum]